MPPLFRPRLRLPWQSIRTVPRRTIHKPPPSPSRIRYHGGKPPPDSDSPTGQRATRKDSKDVLSIQEFVRLAGERKAGVPEATALLVASRASLQYLPVRERRDKAATAGATQVLRWLLGTDPKQWDITITRELAEALCWHLEPEGRSDAVQTWLEIWANDESLRCGAVKTHHYRTARECTEHLDRKSSWPGSVLTGMIRAKIYWSPKNAGPALEFAVNAYDAARDHIFFGYAVTPLMYAITAHEALPCETHLFSRVQELMRHVIREPIRCDEYLAKLLLAHPVSPDPQGILRFVNSERNTTAALSWSDEARQPFSCNVLKAAYICCLRGERDSATILKNWSLKLHPRAFEIWPLLCRRFSKDPKLKDLHERAAMTGVDYRTIAKDMAA